MSNNNKKETLSDKLENLKVQQKQCEANWAKIQGAIEFCESLLEENSNSNNQQHKQKVHNK